MCIPMNIKEGQTKPIKWPGYMPRILHENVPGKKLQLAVMFCFALALSACGLFVIRP